jgi:hypothetical protein
MINKKSIAQILLICFSVILGHQWVPHHHHAETLAPGTTPSCPLDHQDKHTPGEHPFHCHAFNDLAFFKEDPSDMRNQIQENDHPEAITVVIHCGYNLPLTGLIHPAQAPSGTTLVLQDPLPTRGPPASA